MAETNECFISYAHKDIEFAYALRCELNRHCLRCWMDDWRLQAGGDWRSAIGNGLNEASVVVFIASEVHFLFSFYSFILLKTITKRRLWCLIGV